MWCYLCSLWVNLAFHASAFIYLWNSTQKLHFQSPKKWDIFFPSVQFGCTLCFSNQISEGKKCKGIIWKTNTIKNPERQKPARSDEWKTRREAKFEQLPELNSRRGRLSRCVAGNLHFIFSDVMWLKGRGTKKKKRDCNKGVAGDFLVSSLCIPSVWKAAVSCTGTYRN